MSAARENQIDVVGGGVIGLTAAIRLLLLGFRVRIFDANALDGGLTGVSPYAAAFWLPFVCDISEALERLYSETTFHHFRAVARMSSDMDGPGVWITPCRRYFDYTATHRATRMPWWGKLTELRDLETSELPNCLTRGPIVSGVEFNVPVIQTSTYLKWLRECFEKLGGVWQSRRLRSLNDGDIARVVLIATGGYAKQLLETSNDDAIQPKVGALVSFWGAADRGPSSILLNEDGMCSEMPMYVVRLRDRIVVGGLIREVQDPSQPWPDRSSAAAGEYWSSCESCIGKMLDQAEEFWDELKLLRAEKSELYVRTAPRPYRVGGPRVGLHSEPVHGHHVIYCYGHGGSGYTFSVGSSAAAIDQAVTGLGLHPDRVVKSKLAESLIGIGAFGFLQATSSSSKPS